LEFYLINLISWNGLLFSTMV